MVTDRHLILDPDLGAEVNAAVRADLDVTADPQPSTDGTQAMQLHRAEDQGPRAHLGTGKAEKQGPHLAKHVRRKESGEQQRQP